MGQVGARELQYDPCLNIVGLVGKDSLNMGAKELKCGPGLRASGNSRLKYGPSLHMNEMR